MTPLPYGGSLPVMSSSPPLSIHQVQHVARLARLQLSEHQAAQMQTHLAAVLEYMKVLSEIELDNVEPLTHPGRPLATPAADTPAEPEEGLLSMNAPAMNGRFLAVPKIIDDGAGAG